MEQKLADLFDRTQPFGKNHQLSTVMATRSAIVYHLITSAVEGHQIWTKLIEDDYF